MDSELFSPTSKFADFNRRTFIGIVLTGVATAILSIVLARVLNQFIISPALCRSATEAMCANSDITALHVASVISAIIAVVMLVNLSVYRPLLVAIAVTVGTWGIYGSILAGLTWPWAIGAAILVNIIAYLTFSWILRIYNLVIALILTVILVVALLFVSYL